VETVLLRMLRGSGLDGMGAMSFESWTDGICYLRPWLSVTRGRILAFMQDYTEQSGFEPVQDPSNLDVRYARGALRTDILPAIERSWPGYRATFERFARLATESAVVLREVAAADLAGVQEDQLPFQNCLSLSKLHLLPAARQTMVLRLWFAGHGLAMPSEARLQELQRQLGRPATDRQMLLNHEGVHVRRYRDWAIVDRAGGADDASDADAIEILWRGEAELQLETFGGRLRFGKSERGLDPQWLRGVPLFVRWRRGRERLKLSPQTPSRSLKNLYQERGIPSWERERLPLLYRHDTLVYAAGLGVDARLPQTEPGVVLTWLADRPGATVIS
jgi:tRNA(Ile)-lysidine synthase